MAGVATGSYTIYKFYIIEDRRSEKMKFNSQELEEISNAIKDQIEQSACPDVIWIDKKSAQVLSKEIGHKVLSGWYDLKKQKYIGEE